MVVLGIDTSTRAVSVGLVRDGAPIASHTTNPGNHSDTLLADIDELLSKSSTRRSDLSAIAVGVGPGSFTGLRIGMSTGKGLALGLRIPLWTASSLEAIAWQCRPADGTRDVLVIADACRREVFVGGFRVTKTTATPLCSEAVLPPQDVAAFAAAIGAERFTVGQGITLYPEILGPIGAHLTQDSQTPTGVAVAERATAVAAGDMLRAAVPVYIRPSEAEIKFPNGNPGGTFGPKV